MMVKFGMEESTVLLIYVLSAYLNSRTLVEVPISRRRYSVSQRRITDVYQTDPRQ